MSKPTVGSLFSGIGGFDLGLERAGFDVRWQVEIDPFCRKVLASHWPEVTRHGDIRDISLREPVREEWARQAGVDSASTQSPERGNGLGRLSTVDLICGGFPCQDLSVAGKRAGLNGERSGLWFEFYRILSELRPAFCLIENVPGLLSSNQGRDFAVIIDGLGDIWPAVGWAVLDSQHFGVPQRRRRVYIVGSSSRTSVQQILSLCEGCAGDAQAGREAGKNVASTLGGGAGERGWSADTDRMTFVPDVAETLSARRAGDPAHGGKDSTPGNVVAVQESHPGEVSVSDYVWALGGETGQGRGTDGVHVSSGVRRLTPVECERLQGFPDGWTDVGGAKDGPRYKALGNAVTVPVIEYLGQRIMAALALRLTVVVE